MDLPRVWARQARKKLGLPASKDVGILSTVVQQLRQDIESELGVIIETATVTTTHDIALYQDDVADVCEYVGFKYKIPEGLWRPLLWEPVSAYAGYGLGLCEHWQNMTRCYEEEAQLSVLPVLVVHRSRTALTSTLTLIKVATAAWDEDIIQAFTLGTDGMAEYETPNLYWEDVKATLMRGMDQSPLAKPERIILTGDQVDGEFREFLEATAMDCLGTIPPIYSDGAAVVSAKGAAELRRRGVKPY